MANLIGLLRVIRCATLLDAMPSGVDAHRCGVSSIGVAGPGFAATSVLRDRAALNKREIGWQRQRPAVSPESGDNSAESVGAGSLAGWYTPSADSTGS
jgi:hypothetical protein